MKGSKLFEEGYDRDTDFVIKKEIKSISSILKKKFMIGFKYRLEDRITIGTIYFWIEGGDGSLYNIENPQYEAEREKIKKIAYSNRTDPYPKIEALLSKYREEIVNAFKKI